MIGYLPGFILESHLREPACGPSAVNAPAICIEIVFVLVFVDSVEWAAHVVRVRDTPSVVVQLLRWQASREVKRVVNLQSLRLRSSLIVIISTELVLAKGLDTKLSGVLVNLAICASKL